MEVGRLPNPQHAVGAAHGDGAAADGHLARQQVLLAVHGFHGSHNLDRGAGSQRRLRLPGHKWAQMRVNQPFGAVHQEVQTGRTAGHVFRDHLVDRSVDRNFVGFIVAMAHEMQWVSFNCGLGGKWNCCDRKQRAKHAPCDQTSGSSGNTTPHVSLLKFNCRFLFLSWDSIRSSPNVGGQTWEGEPIKSNYSTAARPSLTRYKVGPLRITKLLDGK